MLRYDEYELRPTEIRISDVLLGEGAYGVVYKGTLIAGRRLASGRETTSAAATDEVAIKMLHPHTGDQARYALRTFTLVGREHSRQSLYFNLLPSSTFLPFPDKREDSCL